MSQVIQSGIVDTTVFVLLATSFFLIFNVGKMLHFAHGTAYMLGAYAAYSALPRLPFVLTILVALAAGAAFGLFCEVVIYGPLRARGATGMILLISSLALFIVGENAVGMKYGSQTINVRSALQEPVFEAGGVRFTWIHVLGVVGATAWVLAVALVLSRTSLGFRIRAIADHEALAALTGVSAVRVRRMVFLAASAAVGFAGLIRLVDLNGEPTMGFTGTLFGIVPFIVGGARSVWGSVFGAAIVGFGVNVFGWYAGVEWTHAFVFGVLALVVLLRPEGLVAARG